MDAIYCKFCQCEIVKQPGFARTCCTEGAAFDVRHLGERKAMTAPDISPEAVEVLCGKLHYVNFHGDARNQLDAAAMLRALRSALTAANGQADALLDRGLKMADEIEALRASLTASEKDAARWRLARTRIMWDRYGPSLPCGATKVDPEETDRDIDRAIRAMEETKHEPINGDDARGW